MARVPYLSPGDLAPEDSHLLDRPIDVFRALAHKPGMLGPWIALGEWIRWRGELPPRLRELCVIQVGLTVGCEYEVAHHVKLGIEQFGVTSADIDALSDVAAGSSTDYFDELERAALRAAVDLTQANALDDETWARLQTGLGMSGAVELVVVVSFYNMVVRVLSALEISPEEEYANVLDAVRGDWEKEALRGGDL